MTEVSELAELDAAVAKAQDDVRIVWREGDPYLAPDGFYRYKPSTDWSQGGPIIERERIYLEPVGVMTI